MQPENWKKIKEFLSEALALDPSARRKYLDGLDIDGESLEEIRSLLAQEEESENFMSLSARNFSEDFFPEREKLSGGGIGQKIGIYQIIRELGTGGMGAVYLAERTDGRFEQKVAVKMLRREYNTGKIRERFKREREIQATLSHPNIASLIDAGSTPDGIPYLVMEYIEGEPIDQYCRERNLSLSERLKLFNKACEAVSFAHRNLIVHRDLKPSNILVSGGGEPKLLDFGISTILSREKSRSDTITGFGAMTPKYASPEQIKGENLTTATDIYSLGVVLFKILTGTLPYGSDRKTNGELFKTITEKEPIKPSEAASGGGRPATAQNNPKSKTRNPKLLRGDLDNIVLKTLRKEPERRYQTVDELTDDIWRYIDGLPIRARPATLAYRAKKFYGRNKIPVLAGILTFLGLLTGIAVASWQATVAREQATVAESARKTAESEARRSREEEERAKEITRFMEKILSYANPGLYALGAKTRGQAKVIDVIDQMSDKIENEFPDRKDIQAELHHKFSEIYQQNQHFTTDPGQKEEFAAKGLFHARTALKLRKEVYGEKHELVAKDLFYLWANSPAEFDPTYPGLLAEAIRMMRETNPDNPNLPQMLSSYANRLFYSGTEEEKELYFRGADPPPGTGRLELAEKYHLEALRLFGKRLGEDDISVINANCLLALVMARQKEYEEMKPYLKTCQDASNRTSDEQIRKTLEGPLELIRQTLEKTDPQFEFIPQGK
ncbi:MAG: serine/threonine-protein kinase [Pyrinomonadaceae bacterium]